MVFEKGLHPFGLHGCQGIAFLHFHNAEILFLQSAFLTKESHHIALAYLVTFAFPM